MDNILTLNPPISIKRLPMRLSLRAFWIFSFISIISLLVLYIFQVNFLVSENYLIQDYQKKLNVLTRENRDLEIRFEQVNSLENIESLLSALNFEKVNKIHYIRVLEGEIVKESNPQPGP